MDFLFVLFSKYHAHYIILLFYRTDEGINLELISTLNTNNVSFNLLLQRRISYLRHFRNIMHSTVNYYLVGKYMILEFTSTIYRKNESFNLYFKDGFLIYILFSKYHAYCFSISSILWKVFLLFDMALQKTY